MLVTGTIALNGDGSVRSYTIDRSDRLPTSVTTAIQNALPGWKFQPPEGHPDGVSGKMTLRMLARPIDAKTDRVTIGGASFFDEPTNWHLTYKTREQPYFPTMALQVRESGAVYLLLRVGRDGHVQEAFVEQVNLDAYASPQLMKRLRQLFADSATDAARRWTFNVPTQGRTADAPFWYARVPVTYFLAVWGKPLPDTYGQWQAYVPGPRLKAPWAIPGESTKAPSSDAMMAGALHEPGGLLQLKSTLNGE